MEYRSIKGFTGAAQLGFLLVFLGLGFILAGGAQLLIGFKIVPPGTDIKEMGNAMILAMKNPANVFYTRLAQVLGTFCLLFIPSILYSLLVNGKNKFWLGFNGNFNVYQVLLGFLIMFTANIMASPLQDLTRAVLAYMPTLAASAKEMEQTYNEQVLILSNLKSWPEFITALAIMAFFPALFEEMFFRGALQQLFVKWWKAPLVAIIVTSLLFSFIHGSIYLFLSRAVLGFVLGLMYFKTKNIWINVIAHFLNNAIALAQLFSLSRSNQKIDITKIDPKIEWWFGVIAIAILIFLFRFLDKYSEKNRLRINSKENLLLAENRSNPFTKSVNDQFGN